MKRRRKQQQTSVLTSISHRTADTEYHINTEGKQKTEESRTGVENDLKPRWEKNQLSENNNNNNK